MLKKTLSFVFCFLVFMNSLHASGVDSLKIAYEELQYALTVEWDQKDMTFKQKHTEIFNLKIKEILSQGLSASDLSEFALTQIKSESTRREIETVLSLVKINQLEKSRAQQMIKEGLDKSFNQGASWNGRLGRVEIITIVVIIALIIWMESIPMAPRPLGEQPDGSFCGYSEVCDYEYDYFFEREEWVCRDEYHCVR